MRNVLVILGLIGSSIILIKLLFSIFIYWQKKRFKKHAEYCVLSVQVSRENELGPIMAEQIFATIHSTDDRITFGQKLRGFCVDNISFEIANINKQIKFYVRIPVTYRSLIEGQIYAQYPDVEIKEVEDFAVVQMVEVINTKKDNEKKSDSKALIKPEILLGDRIPKSGIKINTYKGIVGGELSLSSPDIFPIKRYIQFEDKLKQVAVDPIAGITASISKLNSPYDQAWIQIVCRPMPEKWRKIYVDCVRLLSKGIFSYFNSIQRLYANLFCKKEKWFRYVFFPLYFSFFFQRIRIGGILSKNNKSVIDEKRDIEELKEEISRSHDRESPLSAAMDKVAKLLFEVNIRVLYIPESAKISEAQSKVREIAGSFKQFSIPHMNGFFLKEFTKGKDAVDRFQFRKIIKSFVLNTEEIATIFHLPTNVVMTPNIFWVRSKKLEPPSDLPDPKYLDEDEYTLLGKTNFRGIYNEFGIKKTDRRRHIYIIGKTGMGKSTLLENMIFSDIQRGRGLAVIDPHGDLAENIMNFIPPWRTNHVIVFDPSDRDFPVAFNMLENIDPQFNTIVCSGLIGIFKKIYADSWGPRLEHILRNTILSLLEYPNTTMLGITRMLQDSVFRKKVVAKLTDPIVRSFWENEFEKMQDKQKIEAISPILNKVGQFLSSPIIRNIVGQPKSSIDFRFAMDKNKIVIVNLSRGKIGEDVSSLLGSMIITKFQLDAMSRANIPEKDRKDFYLYVDEFQNFATDSFATILSEARKYRLNLTMANQYIAQMPDEVREAVFGNVGTTMAFQVGFTDAEFLSSQFSEEVTENDLISLSKYTAYTKLLVDGMPTKTFSFDTLSPPIHENDSDQINKIIKVAREKYAKPRDLVEDKIKRWHENK